MTTSKIDFTTHFNNHPTPPRTAINAGLLGANKKQNTMKGTAPLYSLKKLQSDFPKERIKNSKQAADFIRQFYGDDLEIFESFFLLLLNQSGTSIGYAKISQGGISGTVVDIRIIAKYATDALAPQIILAHNHPSGSLTPSEQDKAVTAKIQKAMTFFDIRVADHIILTADHYFSFADEGLL